MSSTEALTELDVVGFRWITPRTAVDRESFERFMAQEGFQERRRADLVVRLRRP